jgi:hypothetical protein
MIATGEKPGMRRTSWIDHAFVQAAVLGISLIWRPASGHAFLKEKDASYKIDGSSLVG